MLDFIVTYDLHTDHKDAHGPLLDLAPGHDWTRLVPNPDGGKPSQLPNTTLVGSFDDLDHAVLAFRQLIAATARVVEHPVTVERATLVRYVEGEVWDVGEFAL